MSLLNRIKALWTLSPEAKQVEEEMVWKLNMPEEPDYTANLIAAKGFMSLNDHQLVDRNYLSVLPDSQRVIEIDPAKPIEAELKRARGDMASRAYYFRKRLAKAKASGDWNNLRSVPASELDELSRMAEALGSAKPQHHGRTH